MRTTLNLEEDAAALARRHARRHKVSLGKAVSDLVRNGALRPLETVDQDGLKVAKLPAGSSVVTSEQVARLLEEIP
jgi:hypothetical protein